ncbi:type I 3-dehydroquinate dehydratase [Sulfurihydrogenibium subterraneum]|uniref:type I 3-dehydroquinate dehydratase n=1 Tax=Sulfurihydrogenibium subterraneum TaxID=171121 RepID=UPI0004921511|nr:type I 3-dehydroquinate dehydratase [Sulfurihydrogenibium subterraneum]
MVKLALPITDDNVEDTLSKALLEDIDIIELRIDQFKIRDFKHILDVIKKVKEKGFIALATVRSKLEGGADIPDEGRFEIFSQIADYVDMADIEYTSFKINKQVIDFYHSKGKSVIMSYHDFEKTPSDDYIQTIINESKLMGADIVKYAFKARSFEDVARVMCITHKNREKNLVAILMGEIGKVSRVIAPVFGSLITYTFIGQSFAPGQLEAKKLNELLEFFNIQKGWKLD